MHTGTQTVPVSKKSKMAGNIISGLVVVFMLFDGIGKLMRIAPVVDAFNKLGLPQDLAVPIGILGLVCTAIYAIPNTAILGAVLLTAYFGGATATHVRAGQVFIFPVIFGILTWGGLYLRDNRLHALMPLRSLNSE